MVGTLPIQKGKFMSKDKKATDNQEEEVLELTLERKTKKVKINGKMHTVTELTGLELSRWRSEVASKIKVGSQGQVTGLNSFVGVEAGLIEKCLKDDTGSFVPSELISTWPASVQSKLFELCQEVNGLSDKAEGEEKKS